MKRRVLAIPFDEIRAQFGANGRHDVKVVVPEAVTAAIVRRLQARGVTVKPEDPLPGCRWSHSGPNAANRVCEAADFLAGVGQGNGPFAIAFADEQAPQEAHWHERHTEIYVSESPLSAVYCAGEEDGDQALNLPEGGVIVFAAGVVHRMRLGGLTVVIEVPAAPGDKCTIADQPPTVR